MKKFHVVILVLYTLSLLNLYGLYSEKFGVETFLVHDWFRMANVISAILAFIFIFLGACLLIILMDNTSTGLEFRKTLAHVEGAGVSHLVFLPFLVLIFFSVQWGGVPVAIITLGFYLILSIAQSILNKSQREMLISMAKKGTPKQ